ncbi:type IV conjugative transfer system lipoprotein TraV [Yersinia enterocolitica]|uniref:type IV conjugative transfer system lipoprotein TraV n=1 Tax=Yersinia enterocolitica TaxID=630 RepID=UPI0005DD1CAA|nr:type IV conjugative transfer system lipoprotein TraV [Yersinia enterocolitica]MBW5835473.1 type IV conjugative transfer system lipoprotein TraV [Yersinia enterocolitica]CNL74533.1 conjugal transfer protein TraV [Yersinia enterocolitica]
MKIQNQIETGGNNRLKYAFLFPVLGSLFLLAGCAGVSGDFECNETTTDRCMTMDQANQKARMKTDSSKGKQGAAALPGLVNLPPQASAPVMSPPLPARPVITSPARASESKPVSHTTQNRIFAASTIKPVAPAPVRTVMPVITAASCPQQRCDNLGETRPQRSVDTMANVWVAPWVDANDVFHQPGRVSFVVDASRWQLPQSVY